MSREEMLEQRNEACRERHVLAVDRLRSIVAEETVRKNISVISRMLRFFFLNWKMSDGKLRTAAGRDTA